MAEFLTTKGMASALEDIISEAKATLIIVSPYLKVSDIFKRRLNDAAGRGVHIKMLYGKKELTANELSGLSSIPNIEIIYVANLHAKCYLNEKEVIIGSMNFYDFSETNNNEMGVLLKIGTDRNAFNKAVEEVNSLVANYGKKPDFKMIKPYPVLDENSVKKKQAFPEIKANEGFCIRCRTIIPFDPHHPLCKSCYSVWVQFGNTTYPENCCHGCNKPISTTYDYPQCYSCWSANNGAKKAVLTI